MHYTYILQSNMGTVFRRSSVEVGQRILPGVTHALI